MIDPNALTPEFSRPVLLDRIATKPLRLTFAAEPAECAALAERFAIPAIQRLETKVALRRVRGGSYIELTGTVEGRAVQECVVTLDPVEEDVVEEFTILFGPLDGARPQPADLDLDAEADLIEPLDGPAIDVGEVAAQYFALGLDPYPRKDGAEIPAEWRGDPDATDDLPAEEPEKPNPFAKLSVLKGGKGQGG